jgi:hypothetical protein
VPGCRAAKAGGGKRRQIQLPITWHFDNAKKLGAAVCSINDDFNSGIEPEQAAKTITYTSGSESDARTADTQKANPEQQTDWNGLIERYREYKVRTGEIKESTWTRVHRHHMKHVLEAFVSRQIQMQATSALLLLPCDDWAADWKLADQSSALPISLRYVPASAATTSGSTCTGALSGTSCGWRWRCGWRAFRMCARWRRSISRHGHSVQYVGAMELISALAKAQAQHALEARLTQSDAAANNDTTRHPPMKHQSKGRRKAPVSRSSGGPVFGVGSGSVFSVA